MNSIYRLGCTYYIHGLSMIKANLNSMLFFCLTGKKISSDTVFAGTFDTYICVFK